MILAIDVGNTNIKFGLFDGDTLAHSWRFSNREQTSDELGIRVNSAFNYLGLDMSIIDGIIISSVRPSVNYTIEHMCKTYFNMKPIFVGAGVKTGINILYDNPRELGPDRICSAVAALAEYGGPCITVDFGTATTFGAISERGDFLGGLICPGIKISVSALIEYTATLPKFEIHTPKRVINRSTVKCMQAGSVFGFVGQVEYILRRMREEMGGAKVIATGGMAYIVMEHTDLIDHLDQTLTLKGLRLIYKKNDGGI